MNFSSFLICEIYFLQTLWKLLYTLLIPTSSIVLVVLIGKVSMTLKWTILVINFLLMMTCAMLLNQVELQVFYICIAQSFYILTYFCVRNANSGLGDFFFEKSISNCVTDMWTHNFFSLARFQTNELNNVLQAVKLKKKILCRHYSQFSYFLERSH